MQFREQLEFMREQGIQSAKIDNIEKDLKEIKTKLNDVLVFVNETKGGHRYLWGILTLASALGAVAGSILTYFTR